jgi:hypothetical protein
MGGHKKVLPVSYSLSLFCPIPLSGHFFADTGQKQNFSNKTLYREDYFPSLSRYMDDIMPGCQCTKPIL